MRKIIIDTNVFLALIIGQRDSASRALFIKIFENALTAVMGNALSYEYQDVIARPIIQEKSTLTMQECQALMADFFAVCHWQAIYYRWRPNLIDEGDNHLIELAIASNATHIVTKNIKDFRRSELNLYSISVVTPEQFMQELNDGNN